MMNQEPERMYLVMKMVGFLSKVGKVSYLTALHWSILLELYCQFMSSQRSETKNGCQKVKEIKEMFVFLSRGLDKLTILSDSHQADKISQLMGLWVGYVNDLLRSYSARNGLNRDGLE